MSALPWTSGEMRPSYERGDGEPKTGKARKKRNGKQKLPDWSRIFGKAKEGPAGASPGAEMRPSAVPEGTIPIVEEQPTEEAQDPTDEDTTSKKALFAVVVLVVGAVIVLPRIFAGGV